MKTSLLLITLIPLGLNDLLLQDFTNKIIGMWLLANNQKYGSEEYFIECPDAILIKKNGNYIIFNDCYPSYSEDYTINNYIVEMGNWSFEERNQLLVFKNRSFTGDYYFHDSTDILNLTLVNISEDSLNLGFFIDKEFFVEKFNKIDTN